MKVFVALALLSVALATPVIKPVSLPEAALPDMEDAPYVPVFEPIDIRPLIVPQEVMESLKLLEIPAEIPAEAIPADSANPVYETLKVVDFAELPVPDFLGEIPAEPVNFVDFAENNEAGATAEEAVSSLAEEPAADAAEEIPAEPVNFVDVAENVEADAIAEEAVVSLAEELVADAAEEIPAEPVNFVDVAENIEAAPVDANDVESIAQEAVRVVDFPPRYPGKIFDDPMLR